MKRILLYVVIAAGVVTTSCNTSANRELEAKLQAQQQTIESMKVAMDRQHLIDSMAQVAAIQKETITKEAVAAAKPVTTTRTVYRTPKRSSASANNVQSYAANRSNDNYQPAAQPQYAYQQPVQQPQKRGWSAKAKGAAIGAGVGALGGALIGKRKGTGALIGAGVGALAGLGTGAIIDKRNGR